MCFSRKGVLLLLHQSEVVQEVPIPPLLAAGCVTFTTPKRQSELQPEHRAFTVSAIILESVLTCPYCGFAKRERMPTDACQFYYECNHCNALLRPDPGHCCVFCSLGSMVRLFSNSMDAARRFDNDASDCSQTRILLLTVYLTGKLT